MGETMLRDPRQPVRRTPGIRLDIPLDANETPEKIAWTAAFLQILGVTSKHDTQGALQMDMLAVCKKMEEQTLSADPLENPYCAANLSVEASLPLPAGLKPGPEFMAYLKALKAYESAPVPRQAKVIETLRTTAQGYLDHYEDHPALIQKQPQNLRKKMLCENTLAGLRNYELRNQVQALGNPPWDSAKAMQAASLKAATDFASIPGKAKAEVLGGKHVFPAFWINRADEDGTQEKTFLFKPKSTHSGDGVPKGGETAREAAAGRLGDLLKGATGIDLGVPETQIVALPRNRFPEGALSQVEQTDPLVGSLQQFASADGDLRDQPLADRNKVPAAQCQKMAVLDLLTLNLDRHAGNMMVKHDKTGTPMLTPIDHGLTFPEASEKAGERIARQLGDGFNATLSLPGAHEPFSAEMVEGIDRLDPVAMAAAMKAEVGVIDQAFPGVGNTISDGSIEMSRRSAMFLKLAVRTLSPAAVQVAFGQNATELLDPTLDDAAFTSKARAIIFAASEEQDGLAEYFCMSKGEQSMMTKALRDNGWPVSDRKWLLANPSKVLALYRGNVRNPAIMEEVGKKIGTDLRDRLLKTCTLEDIRRRADDPTSLPPDLSDMTGDERQKQLQVIRTAFPNYAIADESTALGFWKRFTDAGGMTALEAAETKLNSTPEDKKTARNRLDSAVERIAWAKSLIVISDEERDARLKDLEAALANERPDRSKPQLVSEAIKRWDVITRFTFDGQKGFEAIKRAVESLGGKKEIPTTFGAADGVMSNVADRDLVAGPDAQQELRELELVWPQSKGSSNQEQAKALKGWRLFNALGGERAMLEALKSMNLRRADVTSLSKAIETLKLFAASNAAMQDVRDQDAGTETRQPAASRLAFVRQATRFNLPPDHPLHAKIDDVEKYVRLTVGQIPSDLQKLVDVLRVTAVDAIRQVLTPRVRELEQRLAAANKADRIEAAEDGLAGRMATVAEDVTGGQFDENLAQSLDQLAAGIKTRWEDVGSRQPIGPWKPLAA
jgi:hypothetical protein